MLLLLLLLLVTTQIAAQSPTNNPCAVGYFSNGYGTCQPCHTCRLAWHENCLLYCSCDDTQCAFAMRDRYAWCLQVNQSLPPSKENNRSHHEEEEEKDGFLCASCDVGNGNGEIESNIDKISALQGKMEERWPGTTHCYYPKPHPDAKSGIDYIRGNNIDRIYGAVNSADGTCPERCCGWTQTVVRDPEVNYVLRSALICNADEFVDFTAYLVEYADESRESYAKLPAVLTNATKEDYETASHHEEEEFLSNETYSTPIKMTLRSLDENDGVGEFPKRVPTFYYDTGIDNCDSKRYQMYVFGRREGDDKMTSRILLLGPNRVYVATPGSENLCKNWGLIILFVFGVLVAGVVGTCVVCGGIVACVRHCQASPTAIAVVPHGDTSQVPVKVAEVDADMPSAVDGETSPSQQA